MEPEEKQVDDETQALMNIHVEHDVQWEMERATRDDEVYARILLVIRLICISSLKKCPWNKNFLQ